MEKNEMIIKRKDFVKVMDNVESSTIIYLKRKTKVKMNKKGNPYHDQVYKVSEGMGIIGNEYQKRIETELGKEGKEKDFKVGRNKVGYHINKVITRNDDHNREYFMYEWFGEKPPKTEYLFEGNPIDKMLFDSWLIKSNGYYTQPTERKVQVLQVGLDNVEYVTYNKTKYILVD